MKGKSWQSVDQDELTHCPLSKGHGLMISDFIEEDGGTNVCSKRV